MKSKSIVLSLAGLLVSGLMTLAQSAAPATDTNQPATATAAPVTNAVDATATAVPATNTPDASAAPAATNAPDMSATNAPATNAAAAPATNAPEAAAPAATPAPAEVTASPAAAPVVGASNGPPDMSAVIPLIQMEDVPLTDAIKNLARQAGLNYMLDPKINYGAPGPDGRPIPQPTVSLRWENLTPDQALNAVLNNYNLTIVDDARTHTARITIKDPAAPDPLVTKIIQLKYAYATNLVTNVKSILQDKRSNVLPDARTSQLIVVATEKEMDTVDDLIARLDTPTKQVLIEARLIETSKNPTTAKGVDWTGTLSQQHITFGNGNTTGSVLTGAASTAGNTAGNVAGTAVGAVGPPFTGSPTPAGPASGSSSGTTSLSSSTSALTTAVGSGGIGLNTAKGFFPSTAFLNADGVSAVLSFLNNEADTKVISTPRTVTLDNEMATLAVTTAEPIFEVTPSTANTPGSAQVVYTNVGTILQVTPRISANNTIALKVIPEVSDDGGQRSQTVGGLTYTADFFDIRRIQTQVLIPSGNTLVMGGLVSDQQSQGYTKVPGFGDIPVLGNLFRSSNKSQNKRNLLIFITPTIVENEDFQPTESSFLKNKVGADMDKDEFGAWDSGKPQDWSKLFHNKQKQTAETDMDSGSN